MRFVHHEQEVRREVVHQRPRGRPGRPLLQVARVVLDPGAVANLADHLQVVLCALLKPLRLQQLVLAAQFRQPLLQLRLDVDLRRLPLVLWGNEVLGGEDLQLLHFAQKLSGKGVDLADALHLVAEEADAVGCLAVRRGDVESIAADTKRSPLQVKIVPLVVDAHQVSQEAFAPMVLTPGQLDHDLAPFLGITDSVDAGYGGHDDHVPPGEQGGRCGQPQPVDLLVDIGILFDVQIVPGNVGLGLVVVVVGDEVFDRIVGEEVAELGIELGCQRLVVSKHQCGLLHLLDDVGDDVSLPGASSAQERLMLEPIADALHDGLDRLRLVAGRLELGD
jgi:hypothetical protein